MCCRFSGVHLAILFQLTQHHDAAAMILPNHSPEVIYCVVQWTLTGYVATLTPVGLLSSGGGGWIHVSMRLSLSIKLYYCAMLPTVISLVGELEVCVKYTRDDGSILSMQFNW